MTAVRSRWRFVGHYRWRSGLQRGEWWIGARHDFPLDGWLFAVLGLTLLVVKWGPHRHTWALDSQPTRCVECRRPLTPWWRRLRERLLNWWASR